MDEKVTRRNARKALTSFNDESGDWYILDNAAIIMPSQLSRRVSLLFRFSATLTETVNLPALQAALDRTSARFHYFVVELHKGVFWHYLEPCEGGVRVQADSRSPCQDYDVRRRGTPLFRVRARDRRIACEFSHILTDGTGGMRFLKNLLAEYYRQLGVEVPLGADPDLIDLAGPADPEETEDAYNRYYPGSYPKPDHEKGAWRLPGKLLPPQVYRVICGIVPVKETLAVAKSFGVSLTELLTGIYMEALQEAWLAQPEAQRRRARPRLSIEVPVNMRKFHPTKSNRNFSLFVHVQQDMRLGRRDLATIVTKIHHQMRYEIDAPAMARHIKRNVSGGRSLPVRLLPLAIKGPFMRILYSYYGENIISGVLSNLGAVELPPALAERIERFDFLPAPGIPQKTKASVLSYKDKLYISFGSVGQTTAIERHFFTRLSSLGVPVKVECNLEEAP